MLQVLVYRDEQNRVCVVSPTAEALEGLTIEEIADASVPAGKTFEVMGAVEAELLVAQEAAAVIPPLPRLTFWLAAAEIGVTKAGIRAHIDAMPEGVEKFQALAYLEEAQVYRRNDPLLIQMAAVEGITEPELDALWAWAAQTYP